MDRNKVQELAEMGSVSWESVAKACLNYMSEDDVANMAEWHGLIEKHHQYCPAVDGFGCRCDELNKGDI